MKRSAVVAIVAAAMLASITAYAISPYFTESTVNEELPDNVITATSPPAGGQPPTMQDEAGAGTEKDEAGAESAGGGDVQEEAAVEEKEEGAVKKEDVKAEKEDVVKEADSQAGSGGGNDVREEAVAKEDVAGGDEGTVPRTVGDDDHGDDGSTMQAVNKEAALQTKTAPGGDDEARLITGREDGAKDGTDETARPAPGNEGPAGGEGEVAGREKGGVVKTGGDGREDESEESEAPPGKTQDDRAARVFKTYRGEFVGVGDGIHDAQGVAKVLPLTDGGRVLRLEEFRSTNGPDLYVYLSTDKYASDIVSLGSLKANRGDQNYAIPADVDLQKHDQVLIWCKPFHVLFGSAELVQEPQTPPSP